MATTKYDYSGVATTAINLIYRFGASMEHAYPDSTYSKVYSPANGGYVYSNGVTTSNTQPTTTETAEGVIVDFNEDERKDSSIKVGDKKLLTVEITAPQSGDTFTIGTTEYSYINHETIQPASTTEPLLYKVQLRV